MIAPSETWLPLLRSLTAREPSWCLWKDAEKATTGQGDIDSAGPREAWPGIEDEFRTWALAAGAGPVIVCPHLPETLVLAACAAPDRRRLLQLDVYERLARVVAADSLAAVAELDDLGFRRLRRGAEGLFLMLSLAPRGGRRPRDLATMERATRLLRSDPDGVEAAAGLLGAGKPPALAAATALSAGRWSRAAMGALELVYVQSALRRPRRRLAWLAFRLGAGGRCPLLAALAAGRCVTGDVETWLASVRSSHLVFEA